MSRRSVARAGRVRGSGGGAQRRRPSHRGRAARLVETCWRTGRRRRSSRTARTRKERYFVYVAHEQAAVASRRAPAIGSSVAWGLPPTRRSAREKPLAESMRSTMRSSRSAAVQMFGGATHRPSLRLSRQLSIVDKSRVLADQGPRCRDQKFDPQCRRGDRGGSSARRYRHAAIADRPEHREQGGDVRLGAFTVVQCEGPSGRMQASTTS